MKGTIHVLGYDFGASSGRAMLGELTNGKLTLTEVHRFSNDPVILNGRFVWDVPRLFFEMKQALVKVAKMGVKLDGIGVQFGRAAGALSRPHDRRHDGKGL